MGRFPEIVNLESSWVFLEGLIPHWDKESIHGQESITKGQRTKTSEQNTNCENSQNKLEKLVLPNTSNSNAFNSVNLSIKPNGIKEIQPQQYKNARLIILCDSAGLVYDETPAEEEANFKTKEQTKPLIIRHNRVTENTSLR